MGWRRGEIADLVRETLLNCLRMSERRLTVFMQAHHILHQLACSLDWVTTVYRGSDGEGELRG